MRVGLSATVSLEEQVFGQVSVLPAPVEHDGLIDTGASRSIISATVSRELQLQPVGRSTAVSFDGTRGVYPIFAVRLLFPDSEAKLTTYPIGVADPLDPGAPHVLLGRDVLGSCLLQYNGLTGEHGLYLVSA